MLLLKLICRLSKTRQYHSYFALQKLTTTRLPSLLSLYRYNYYHTLTSNLPKTQHNTTQHNIIINNDIIYYQKMFNPPFIKICNAIGIIDVTSTWHWIVNNNVGNEYIWIISCLFNADAWRILIWIWYWCYFICIGHAFESFCYFRQNCLVDRTIFDTTGTYCFWPIVSDLIWEY